MAEMHRSVPFFCQVKQLDDLPTGNVAFTPLMAPSSLDTLKLWHEEISTTSAELLSTTAAIILQIDRMTLNNKSCLLQLFGQLCCSAKQTGPHRACQRMRRTMKLLFTGLVSVFVDEALLRGCHCKNTARGDWLSVAPKSKRERWAVRRMPTPTGGAEKKRRK